MNPSKFVNNWYQTTFLPSPFTRKNRTKEGRFLGKKVPLCTHEKLPPSLLTWQQECILTAETLQAEFSKADSNIGPQEHHARGVAKALRFDFLYKRFTNVELIKPPKCIKQKNKYLPPPHLMNLLPRA